MEKQLLHSIREIAMMTQPLMDGNFQMRLITAGQQLIHEEAARDACTFAEAVLGAYSAQGVLCPGPRCFEEALMDMLYDMHCHLDFAEDSESVARASSDAGIRALACTVVPSSYVADQEKFHGCNNISLSLGMHPWWVADQRVSEVDIARFEQLLPEAAFIGEVGLDLAGPRKETRTRQLEVLTRILQDIHGAGDGRTITFHAVHASTLLMDLLDDLGTFNGNAVIFHWFQGSHEEFGRVVASGASLSVSMRMMATDKGAAFAAAIPDEQLLVETDAPAHEGSPWDAGMWLQELRNTVKGLAGLRGCSFDHLAALVAANAERVLNAPAL